ncbi:MAG: hypothetical protein DRN81_06465, partial [Thermoproteota archaeon]
MEVRAAEKTPGRYYTLLCQRMLLLGLTFIICSGMYADAANLSGTLSRDGMLYEGKRGKVTNESSSSSAVIAGQVISTSYADYVFVLPSPKYGTFRTLKLRVNGDNLAWNGVYVEVFNAQRGTFERLYLHDYTGLSPWYDIDPRWIPTSGDGYDVYSVLCVRLETPGGLDSFRARKLELSFSFDSGIPMTDADLKMYYACAGAIHQLIKAGQAVKEFDFLSSSNFYNELFMMEVAAILSFARDLASLLGPNPGGLIQLVQLGTSLFKIFQDIFALLEPTSFSLLANLYSGPAPSHSDPPGFSEGIDQLKDKFLALVVALVNYGSGSQEYFTAQNSLYNSLSYTTLYYKRGFGDTGPSEVTDSYPRHALEWYSGWKIQYENEMYSERIRQLCRRGMTLGEGLKEFFQAWLNTLEYVPHKVSTPAIPSGPSEGVTGENLIYTTGGSSCSWGHAVEYRFDWGDGSYSDWGPPSRSHSYSNKGDYIIRAQARCATDNSIVSNWSGGRAVHIRSPLTKIAIYLTEGFNLISFNVLPSNNDFEAVIGSLPKGSYRYVAGFVDGQWETWISGVPSFVNNLRTLSPLQGYWIYMTSAQKLEIEGTPVAPDTPIFLNEGPNLISYLPSQPDLLSHALSGLPFGSYKYVAGFVDGSWRTWALGRPEFLNDLKVLYPGRGYWITMASAQVLRYPSGGYTLGGVGKSAALKPSAQSDDLSTRPPPTPLICDFWSRDTECIRIGDVITARDPDGVICGVCVVNDARGYLLHVSG